MAPRPQPHGLATGRGQSFRVSGPRGHRRPVSAAAPLEIVGWSVASFPPSLGSAGGPSILISVPAAAEVGDWAITGVYCSAAGSGFALIPSDWTTLQSIGDLSGVKLGIFSRQIDGTEPSSYEWWVNSDTARGAVMVVVRNVGAVGPSVAATGSLTVPDIDFTSGVEGSMLIAFGASRGVVAENWTAVSPLTLGAQHVTANGGTPYGQPAGIAVATEENLSLEVISGRSFTRPSFNTPSAGGVILEP